MKDLVFAKPSQNDSDKEDKTDKSSVSKALAGISIMAIVSSAMNVISDLQESDFTDVLKKATANAKPWIVGVSAFVLMVITLKGEDHAGD